MNAIMCELCGSNDVVKQGEYFVCQHCGTKYSLEDARKLIGTVKIDNSDYVQKYLQNARRAKEKEDWEETEKYYNMVEQNDPDNIEAIFYSAYGKAKASLTSSDIYKRQAIFNSLQKCISIVDDHYDITKEEELAPIIKQISKDIINLCQSNFVYTKVETSSKTTDNSDMTYQLFISLNAEFATTLKNIIEKFPEGKRKDVDYLYSLTIKHLQYIVDCPLKNWDTKRQAAETIKSVHRAWRYADPNHKIPDDEDDNIQRIKSGEQKEFNKGCFWFFFWCAVIAIVIVLAIIK